MNDAKLSFIEAFFDGLKERIAYLRELNEGGHDSEAMLLCCCYIDGLANHLYTGDDGSHRNFVRAIREFGDTEWLTRIHIRQLRESFDKMRSNRAQEALVLLQSLPTNDLLDLPTRDDFLAQIPSSTDDSLVGWLREQLWRGTLASIVYTRLRVPSVHGLGAPGGISFEDSRIDGSQVSEIDFDVLHKVVERICTAARDLSVRSVQWFGRG